MGVHFGSRTLRGRKVPLDERGEGGWGRREKEELKKCMRMAMALGTPGLSPALWGQGLVSIGHPSQLCFAHKQVVGIIVESAALRDGPPLDVNQGQGEERRREERKGRQERREQGGWSAADGISISWKY